MKRFVLFFLCALILISGVQSCFAEDLDNYVVDYFESGECGIDGYMGDEKNLVIPDSFDGFPLTMIRYEAFIYNTDLKTVIIPEGVTIIDERAFYGCENLERIVLPSTIYSIEAEAFANCISLKTMVVPKNASICRIAEDAFLNCSQLQMTSEDIGALIDPSYEQAEQALAEQQAAFVVDENAMVELAGYLATDMDSFGLMYGGSEWNESDRWGYAADEWRITSVETWNYIEEIELRLKCNYSLCGIYVSMDAKEARNQLLKSGWKIYSNDSERIIFEDDMENWISISFGADNIITSVRAMLNYNIISELLDGVYDGRPVIILPDAQEAGMQENASSAEVQLLSAHTTSDVNMRAGAGTGHDVVCVVPQNSAVEYTGESAVDDRGVEWYRILYDGNEGWCSSKYVNLD